MGRRVKFILSLILLAICLHLAARNMRTFFSFLQGIPPAEQSVRRGPDLSVFLRNARLGNVLSSPTLRRRPAAAAPSARKNKKSAGRAFKRSPVNVTPPLAAGPWVLQITDEETRAPVQNIRLSPADKKILERDLLAQRRAHDKLVRDMTAWLGLYAGQETLAMAVKREQALDRLAETVKSLDEFAFQKQQILQNTQHELNALLRRNVKTTGISLPRSNRRWDQ